MVDIMNILSYDKTLRLPSAEELPDSDDTPVDSELQYLISYLVHDLLFGIFADRDDWFWGVNMGIYYNPGKPALIPDGFLSLGVQQEKSTGPRPSYVLWEEEFIVPILVMEVIFKTYGGEYEEKMTDYAELGALYYVIYNPFCRPRLNRRRGPRSRHDDHQTLEVYRLEGDRYVLLPGDRIWLPEIELAIGVEQGRYRRRTGEWIYCYDREGERYLTTEELALQQRQRVERERQLAQLERQRADRLAEYLRSQGIDPDNLPGG